jgi:hypothetical protein
MKDGQATTIKAGGATFDLAARALHMAEFTALQLLDIPERLAILVDTVMSQCSGLQLSRYIYTYEARDRCDVFAL